MNHIRRKFSHQVRISDEVMRRINEGLQANVNQDRNIKFLQPSDYHAWIITDKNYCAKTFRYPFAGNSLFIPEPDPVLIYFNIAQINYRLVEKIGSRQELIEVLREFKDATKIMHKLYEFLGHSSSFAVFTFMAIECAVNKVIPDNHDYFANI